MIVFSCYVYGGTNRRPLQAIIIVRKLVGGEDSYIMTSEQASEQKISKTTTVTDLL
jgi:hypothetical protein